MSKLKIAEILAQDGSLTTEVSIPSLDVRMVKSFGSYNGSTNAINGGYKFASLVDNGTGNHTINLGITLSLNGSGVVFTGGSAGEIVGTIQSATELSIITNNSSGTPQDFVTVFFGVFEN